MNETAPLDEAVLWLQNIATRQDKAAFVALFNAFAPKVKAYVRRQGGGQGIDSGQADDITQDVMLQVWNRAAQFDVTKARPSTWIYTIARNRLIDVWRQQKNNLVEFQDPAYLPETSYDQIHAIDSENETNTLRDAVAELSTEQRAIIEESYFEERSHRMIAKARKIPLGTVKSRLRLALDHLRQKIIKRV
jgi:RNA polymerase sigma factor (sigma-70 family)